MHLNGSEFVFVFSSFKVNIQTNSPMSFTLSIQVDVFDALFCSEPNLSNMALFTKLNSLLLLIWLSGKI